MLVKMLTTAAGPSWPGLTADAGQVVDVPDSQGQELITRGFAVAAPDPRAAAPDTKAGKGKGAETTKERDDDVEDARSTDRGRPPGKK